MKIRERNLEMRYDLSFLNHLHAINRPYVFSYYCDWPLANNAEKSKVFDKNSDFN